MPFLSPTYQQHNIKSITNVFQQRKRSVGDSLIKEKMSTDIKSSAVVPRNNLSVDDCQGGVFLSTPIDNKKIMTTYPPIESGAR